MPLISAFVKAEDIITFAVCSATSLQSVDSLDWKKRFVDDFTYMSASSVREAERRARGSVGGWKRSYLWEQEAQAELEAGIYQGMC